MGQKTVRFSDLSGQLIMEEDAFARIVVHEHPELGDGPVEIEVLADEAKAVEHGAVPIAIVDLYLPGEDEPRRAAVEAAEFDKLSTERPMAELLTAARRARKTARAGAGVNGASRDRADYATLEHAGRPHRGKVTDAEKELVRDHLDEINERLAARGIRAISLSDPEHVERYDLQDLISGDAAEREPDGGV